MTEQCTCGKTLGGCDCRNYREHKAMTGMNLLFPLTHAQLVRAAYEWVLKRGSCGVAFREFRTSASEFPDVIGFGCGTSTLIECKVSRADFYADAKKKFRGQPERGMGNYRYYCCPTGLIRKAELPLGWGLLYVDQSLDCRAVLKPSRVEHKFPSNVKAEHQLMYSALRRLHLRGRIEEVYTDPSTIKPNNP